MTWISSPPLTIATCLAPASAIRNSWKPWRALLAAAFGLPLSEDALALFRQCTGRRVPPGAPAAYLWLVIGRRGGKSFAMALIAVFLAAFRDWRKYLSPGERAIVLLVAADREQAKILHRYCQGILRPPILQSLVLNVTASEIELKGGVTIEVVTRSYRTVRGRSVCVAVLDELAFWRDDDSANPDAEVLNAIRASMATFGSDAMVIAGSSHMRAAVSFGMRSGGGMGRMTRETLSGRPRRGL